MKFPELTRKQVIKMLEEKGLEWKVDKYGDLLYLDVFVSYSAKVASANMRREQDKLDSKETIYMWVQAPVTNKQVGEFLDFYQEV